jgi:hypothetical protein
MGRRTCRRQDCVNRRKPHSGIPDDRGLTSPTAGGRSSTNATWGLGRHPPFRPSRGSPWLLSPAMRSCPAAVRDLPAGGQRTCGVAVSCSALVDVRARRSGPASAAPSPTRRAGLLGDHRPPTNAALVALVLRRRLQLGEMAMQFQHISTSTTQDDLSAHVHSWARGGNI